MIIGRLIIQTEQNENKNHPTRNQLANLRPVPNRLVSLRNRSGFGGKGGVKHGVLNVDHRYLYLLQRHPDGSVVEVFSVKVFWAYRKEQRLHSMFSCSRFTWTSKIKYGRWAQDHFKVGIATNMESRLRSINKDTSSGKTEWFAFTWLEVLFVMGWMCWFKIRPYVNVTIILFLSIVFAALALT